MYAVIESGGKHYKVVVGEKLRVEKLSDEVGSEVILGKVLAVGEGENIKVGSPNLDGVNVLALVISQERSEKVKIFKMRRRKHYQRRQGHRQSYTQLEILSINS